MRLFLAAGIDVQQVEKCVGDPDADIDIPILKGEQESQVHTFEIYSIILSQLCLWKIMNYLGFFFFRIPASR